VSGDIANSHQSNTPEPVWHEKKIWLTEIQCVT